MMKNIAVITGGNGAEREISLKSAKVVFQHLDASKYNPYLIVINKTEWVVESSGNVIAVVDKNDFSAIVNGNKVYFDQAFIALHGSPAEDGKLQGYLDMMEIPYNCCGVLPAALTFDKSRCKEFLSFHGVKTAMSQLLRSPSPEPDSKFSFPLFVKPNKNGSSFGASKVNDISQWKEALENAFAHDEEVLVEEYLQGTEVTCGVIKIDKHPVALPLTEIRPKSAFFDFKAKYEGASQEITPAEISPALTEQIQRLSEKIYSLLGMKGMCRIDYIIKEGVPYLLEVNSIPGLTEESILPQQARVFGLSLKELFSLSLEAED
ncbi:MAG: D-alanine--D-alanine ligase [Chitinophagales bacterium]|nr:D-alanine--D-alanine ligase [Chitinophagales bacterium]MDW8273224.1 D-alanine--D-alanine ligase [Chitinophagales bacterium]